MINDLKMGLSYFITTKNDTLYNKKILILGKAIYDEVNEKIPYDIHALALNERVTNESELELFAYFADKNLYYGNILNEDGEETNNKIAIWDDVIDYERSSELSRTYKFNFTFDLPITSELTKTEIIDRVKSYFEIELGPNVSNFFIEEDLTSKDNEYIKLMKKAELGETFINKLSRLQSVEKIIDKINSLDVTKKFENIDTNLTEIDENIKIIKRAVY